MLNLAPDLVLLDVQMPGMNGFEVLRALPAGAIPAVIFVTAYDRYAVEAFRVHALDYLLKPVDDRLLFEAVARARVLTSSGDAASMRRVVAMLREGAGSFPAHFTTRTGDRIQVIPVEKICWIGAAGDYVELHSGAGTSLLRETISAMETKLDPAGFLRIHRSRIVRTACIREMAALAGRRYLLRLSDGSEHLSSRRCAGAVESWMNTSRK